MSSVVSEDCQEPRILIVEENEYHGLTMGRQISRRVDGSQIVIARSADDALGYARSQAFDIAVIDFTLSDCDGFGLLHSLHQINPNLAIIVVAEEISEKAAREIFKSGCDELLVKDSSFHAVIPRMVAGVWSRKQDHRSSKGRGVDQHHRHRIRSEVAGQIRAALKQELHHHIEQIIRTTQQILARTDLDDNNLTESIKQIQQSALSVRRSLDIEQPLADLAGEARASATFDIHKMAGYAGKSG